MAILLFNLNFILKISVVCVLHNDMERAFFSLVHLMEFGDVLMVKNLKNLGLLEAKLSFLIIHRRNIHLLDNSQKTLLFVLYKMSCAIRSLAEGAHVIIEFVQSLGLVFLLVFFGFLLFGRLH